MSNPVVLPVTWFKTTEQMITKVKAVRKYKAEQSNIDIPDESDIFYQEKFSE